MGVVEHLEELRKRLLITIGWFLVFLLAGFLYAGRIYSLLTAGLPFRLTVLGPSDVLWVYFALSGTAALAFTLPVAGLQCWLFVKPGLHANEQKAALSYIPFLFLLFAAGLLIGYFFVLPNIFHFLNLLGQGMFTEMYTVDKYFTFVFDLVVPFAACFDMPVIIMFLTSIGLIEPSLLRRVRRYAYFILVVVACCISPPDFVSHISVSIPLILLYECGVLLADVGYRRRLRRLERYEKA
ncbi:twin-arginine translocase subunit TatC [Ectobacillus ponti]|uniref:Sec-independent protein translocase protein TatC n=1 Tax=Ectobacillus ponti TaxID=2961894 RepID=A0AA41X5Q0_9BACI|nr:twin-arginine translocase subunit TatC [Ectobacillus ponti]MCP8967325.1 twin-arginine translocase subunit TatC [Ectobacillus ponti]